MNDLQWLANHPLQGNVAGIPTSQNPDTPEGLESRLSVGIHRIPAELLHLTVLELEKPHRTQMDSCRASALELLWGLLTSGEVLRPSKPTSLSLLYKDWTWEHYRKLNLTFFTLSAEGSRRVFLRGLSRCLGQNWGSGGPLVRTADHLCWSGSQTLW
jgi:hypothetical protein